MQAKVVGVTPPNGMIVQNDYFGSQNIPFSDEGITWRRCDTPDLPSVGKRALAGPADLDQVPTSATLMPSALFPLSLSVLPFWWCLLQPAVVWCGMLTALRCGRERVSGSDQSP